MIPFKDERNPATDDEMAELLSDAASEQWQQHRAGNPKIQTLVDGLSAGVLTPDQFGEALFGVGWMIGWTGGVSFGFALSAGAATNSVKVN